MESPKSDSRETYRQVAKELYPKASEEELALAAANLERYMNVVLRVAERVAGEDAEKGGRTVRTPL